MAATIGSILGILGDISPPNLGMAEREIGPRKRAYFSLTGGINHDD